MCTWFGYNPWINFCHFFHFVNFVIFWPQILRKCTDSGYLVSATPYTISCLSICNFAHLFLHGLKMCMWFRFNPAVNFCHFSTLLTLSTLSFFAGATSSSPIYFFRPYYLVYYSVLFFQDFMATTVKQPWTSVKRIHVLTMGSVKIPTTDHFVIVAVCILWYCNYF